MNMKLIISLSLCAVVLAGLGLGVSALNPPSQKTAEKKIPDPGYLDTVREFSARSASNILGSSTVNSNYSPVSLYMAISLVGTGANGATQAEILETLGAKGMTPAQLAEQSGRLLDSLSYKEDTGSCELANSLWLNNKASFKPAFTAGAKKNFAAELFNVDFGKSSTGKQMGSWIKKNTHGLLAPQIQTDPGELLSIINTLYFYEEWLTAFPENLTKPDIFYLATPAGAQAKPDFMHLSKEGHPYVDGDGYISASLPLKDRSKLLFILPDKGVSPQSLLATPEKAAELFAYATDPKRADVNFSVPKFKFGSKYSLAENLKALGMKTAFSSSADFSGISKTSASISSVIQQTRVAVDEKGVEAAAYTEVMMEMSMPPPKAPLPVIEFKLDRPFIYAIVREDLPLFIGVVQNPTLD